MGLFGSAPKAPKPSEASRRADAVINWALQNRRLTPYGGDWVADMTPGQTSAIDAITKRGMAKSPLLTGAQGYAGDVIGGKYLDQGNPHLAQAMAAARDDIGREVGGAFSTGGMAGSPMHQQFLTEAWSKATAPLLFQNYENERQNQQQMAGLSPELANSDFVGLNQALGAQSVLQQQQQAETDALRERWDLKQNEAYRRVAAAGGGISANPASMGQGSIGSRGLVPGILQGAAGGGLAGLATGNPYAAGGGAILGGLGGGAANK